MHFPSFHKKSDLDAALWCIELNHTFGYIRSRPKPDRLRKVYVVGVKFHRIWPSDQNEPISIVDQREPFVSFV